MSSKSSEIPTMHTITFEGLRRGSTEVISRVQWRYGDWIANRVARLYPDVSPWTITDYVVTSMEAVFPKLTKKSFLTEDKKPLQELMSLLVDNAAKKILRSRRFPDSASQQKRCDEAVEKVCTIMSASEKAKRMIMKIVKE